MAQNFSKLPSLYHQDGLRLSDIVCKQSSLAELIASRTRSAWSGHPQHKALRCKRCSGGPFCRIL